MFGTVFDNKVSTIVTRVAVLNYKKAPTIWYNHQKHTHASKSEMTMSRTEITEGRAASSLGPLV